MVETQAVDLDSLKLARSRSGLSVSELARACAEQGDDVSVRSVRARLDRVENGRGSRVDRTVVAMLCRHFELSEADLARPPMQAWVTTAGAFMSLALRWPIFSTQQRAYDARDLIAGIVPGFLTGAALAPVFASDVERVIAHNFGELPAHQRAPLLVVDPSDRELTELAVWVHALHGTESEQREGAAKTLAELTAKGESVSVLTPDALYELAVKRRRHWEQAPKGELPTEHAERWAREEDRLLDAARIFLDERRARALLEENS